MDILTTKLKLLKSNSETDNNDLGEDFWYQLTKVEKEEIINEIDELDHGKRISHESFLNKI